MKSTMRFEVLAILLALSSSPVYAQKDSLRRLIDDQTEMAWPMASKIWAFAEPGYQEKQSSALLGDYLEKAGFKVVRGVAKIPTALTATFGSGEPVIGILGEYDALPELAQEAVPFRQPRKEGNGYGQACGHHLFGVASAMAAVAIARQIQEGSIKGTVRYYGCPAEEGGAAKVFMARDGLFNDLDVCLHWHPGSRNSAGDQSCLSRIAVKFRFHGTPAHAAGSPEKGRSALDALLLTMHAVELLREHTPDGTRLHHTITSGGGAANVVPEFTEGFFYVRHPQSSVVSKLYPRLLKCAEAGALATETRLEVQHLGGTLEILPNNSLARLTRANLTALNDLKYDAEEIKFATRIQQTFEPVPLEDIGTVHDVSGRVGMGSTDVGDVSWIVPTTGFSTACWVPGTPGHSWQAVACGGTSIGKKGMILAARTLAATAWDLYQDRAKIQEAKAEFARRTAGRQYQSLLLKDQQAPLDYRNSGKRAGGE